MFKVSEVERKTREINPLIDMQINLSSRRSSDYYFSQSLQQFSWDLLGTKYISSTHAQKVNKSLRQKRCCRNHILYILLK